MARDDRQFAYDTLLAGAGWSYLTGEIIERVRALERALRTCSAEELAPIQRAIQELEWVLKRPGEIAKRTPSGEGDNTHG